METAKQSKFVSLFAIAGFAILLIIGLWSTIQVVRFVPRMFGGTTASMPSLKFGKDNSLKITIDTAEVNSGEKFDITWENGKDNKDGILSFSYACKRGFHFRLNNPKTNDYTVLPCNAPYNIPAGDTHLTVTPISDSNRYIDVPFAITFTNTEGKSVRDSATLTVTNRDLADSPDTLYGNTDNNPFAKTATTTEGVTETNNTAVTPLSTNPAEIARYTGKEGAVLNTASASNAVTYKTITKKVVRYVRVPVAPYSNPNGIADLSVEIVRAGAINPYTGAKEAKGVLHASETGFVTLKVTNKGDKATGPWMFNASLPTNTNYVYTSKTQPSLMPNATAEITVTFDQLKIGRNNFRVDVNPFNTVPETTHANNTAAFAFSIINF